MEMTGGNKLQRHLARIAAKLGKGGVVNVGFLEGATYPGDPENPKQAGMPVAQVAFFNEFGTSRAPPRPFFRGMIAAKSPRWGDAMAKIAKATNYDSDATLALMGTRIKDQLVHSINELREPALAPSTIARKGFDKPLIETAHMLRSVDFQVLDGESQE